MNRKPTIIAGIIACIIAIVLTGLSINTDKKNSPVPKAEMKISSETVDIRFLQIRTMKEKKFYLEGVRQFDISEDETQLAVIPYTNEKCCVFDSSGKYLYSIFFNSNNESYALYYEGNNLILFIGGDEQILIKFSKMGDVLSSMRLDRTLSGNHDDWLMYFKYNNIKQVNNNTYQKSTDNLIFKVLGIDSMIQRTSTESKIIIAMDKKAEAKVLLLKIYDLFMRIFMVWIIVFGGLFMCINPSIIIKYFSKKG